MCLYPRIIKNKKYTANKKNGGIVPPLIDERVGYVPIGCGKCMECRRKVKREWQVRLNEELRSNKEKATFVTWTFNDKALHYYEELARKEQKETYEELKRNGMLKTSTKRNKKKYLRGYELDNEVCRIAVRRYTERWRRKHKKTLRHWIVPEIGKRGTERLHIHGIVWTNEIKDITDIWNNGKIGEAGRVDIGYRCDEKTINYIIKYLVKQDEHHKEYKPKLFVSQGIGRNYLKRLDSSLNKYKKGETDETYKTRKGLKLALPIYYRNKLYNEYERELLWLEKLDKNERWVDKERIDVSENDEDYKEALKDARLKNKRLGYGNDKQNWKLKEYEKQKRNLKRIQRARKVWAKSNA